MFRYDYERIRLNNRYKVIKHLKTKLLLLLFIYKNQDRRKKFINICYDKTRHRDQEPSKEQKKKKKKKTKSEFEKNR